MSAAFDGGGGSKGIAERSGAGYYFQLGNMRGVGAASRWKPNKPGFFLAVATMQTAVLQAKPGSWDH